MGQYSQSETILVRRHDAKCHVRREKRLLRYRRDSRNSGDLDLGRDVTISVLLRAVARDVAGFTALIAGLTSSVERTTIWRSTVSRDVTEFSTCIALHRLSLAIARKVVWPAAFVAGSRSGATSECASAETTAVSTTGDRSATPHSNTGRVRAGSSQVTGLAAVVATAVTTSTAQTEGRAVSLNVPEPLTVIALLCLSGTRERTLVRLMS